MIRRAHEMKRTYRENMRGGQGTVEILSYFEEGQLHRHTRLLGRLTIKPGDSIGLHRHEDEEEVFIVLQGEGTVSDGAAKDSVRAGDAILTGSGESHAIENTGKEDLEIIAIIVRHG